MRTRDVADFIRARLDEDEAAARAATPGAWKIRPRLEGVCIDAGRYDQVIAPGVVSCGSYCYGGTSSVDISDADAEHIARHDPARVFADIAAKREIVAWVGDYDADPDGSAWGILGHLAALYADHPDYQQEWRSALDDDSEGGS